MTAPARNLRRQPCAIRQAKRPTRAARYAPPSRVFVSGRAPNERAPPAPLAHEYALCARDRVPRGSGAVRAPDQHSERDPLANVQSPDNLSAVNGNAYTANAASGPIYVGSAGDSGFGSIESSSLESSTVDIATELTDMIQAQSAYEANSKVFQTGADILDVLNNLKP